MSNEINLKEESPYGKPWGRCSKHELVRLIFNLAGDAQNMKSVIYMRDLLYNGCHESNQIVHSWTADEEAKKAEQLNKAKSIK